MPKHEFHLLVIILSIASFDLFFSISDRFVFFPLYIIYLCYIIWYNRFVCLFVLHYFKTFQCFIIITVPKSQETVIIVCINIIGIVFDLPYRVEKRFCMA